MIPAAEALALPTAQLTEEQKKAADDCEREIDKAVRSNMGRNGIDLVLKQSDPAIIAEVNQRLRAVGWGTNWNPIVEQHRINTAKRSIVAYNLNLYPNDDSYKAHGRSILS